MRNIPKRRRREGKTDYKHRKNMLKGEKPRAIFRKTNKQIIGQIVVSTEAQDKVVATVMSKELLETGWPKEWEGSLKSMPAAYLTGMILGKKALEKKINEGILDIGLYRNIKKSRMYSFAKGLIDAGVVIPVNEEMLPEMERIQGMHMKKDVKTIMDKVIKNINGGKK